MKVRMLTIAAGPEGNLQPGDVVELSEELAQAYIDGGYAVEVKTKAKAKAEIETAAVEPEETTARPPAKRRSARKAK